MKAGTRDPSLRAAREQIAEAIRDGVRLDEVADRLIDRRPVSRDARDALWLYAWTTAERGGSCRREVPTA